MFRKLVLSRREKYQSSESLRERWLLMLIEILSETFILVSGLEPEHELSDYV